MDSQGCSRGCRDVCSLPYLRPRILVFNICSYRLVFVIDFQFKDSKLSKY
jgi:hypothetical protein